MREYTAKELIAEIRRQAKSLTLGLDSKVYIGDIEGNHAGSRFFIIEGNADGSEVGILCDPDEVC